MPKDKHEKHDNFLADAINPKNHKHIGYWDGFRFGLGFFVAGLLVTIILGGLTWGVLSAMAMR